MKPKFGSDSLRVPRGGSWGSTADNARAAGRFRSYPGYRFNYLGFRLCRDVPFTADNPTPTRRSEDVQED